MNVISKLQGEQHIVLAIWAPHLADVARDYWMHCVYFVEQ